jgi:ribonuclease T1
VGVLGRRSRIVVVTALAACLVGCSASSGGAGPTQPTATPPTASAPSSAAPTAPSTPSASSASSASPSDSGSDSSPQPTNYPDADTLAPAVATTKRATISVEKLPAEAVDTLQLIRDGGPFPFPRDGLMFQNREGNLPKQEVGFYHEYTVETPGAGDRGARRIVTGADGSRFWTTDHYDSFREVIAPWS